MSLVRTTRSLLRRPLPWALAFAAASVGYACSSGPGRGARSEADVTAARAELSRPGVTRERYPTDYVPCHEGTMATCAAYEDRVARVVDGLRAMRRSPERGDVPIGLGALDVPSAVVSLEAIKLLGPYADDANVESRLASYLVDPHAALQMEAARALERSSNAGPVVAMWKQGHKTYDADPHDHDPDRDPTTWGWVWYDGASAFPPGDGPSTIGMSTSDSVEQVAAYYDKTLHAKAVDFAAYQAALQGLMSRLLAKATAPGADGKAMSRLERMAPVSWPFPDGDRREGARYLLLADPKTPDAPTRFGVIYREPLYDVTVVILAWDGEAYPRVPRIARPLSIE